MRKVRLGDICDIIGGYAFKSEEFLSKGIPLVRISNIDEQLVHLDEASTVYLPENYLDKYTSYLIKPNDILIALSGATTGKYGIYKETKPALLNQRVGVFRIKNINETTPAYIYYYLNKLKKEVEQKAKGAGQPNISTSEIANLTINIPESLETQQQIVAVLDKAQSIIEKRKASLQLLDKLLRDTFLDMFGDPVSNPKGWKKDIIRNITTKIGSGSTPLGGKEVYGDKGFLFIRSQNILMNEVDYDSMYHIDASIHNKMKGSWVKKGDVLLNITGASIGRVAFYDLEDDKANVNQHVCIIRPDNKKVLPEYLSYLISTDNYQSKIKSVNTGGTRESFNFKQIGDFELPVADLNAQKKFALFYKKSNLLKSTISNSLTQSQTLFQSLLQKAFSTEGLPVNTKELAIQNKISDIQDVKIIIDALPLDSLPKKEKAQVQELTDNLGSLLDIIKPFKTEKDLDKTLDKLNLGALKEYISPTAGSSFITHGGGTVGGLDTGTFYTIDTKGDDVPPLQVNDNVIDLLQQFNLKKTQEVLEKTKTEQPAIPETPPKEEQPKEEAPKQETKPVEEKPKEETKPVEEKHKPADWKEQLTAITKSLPPASVLSFADFAKPIEGDASLSLNDPNIYTGIKEAVFEQLRNGQLKQVYGPDKETVAKLAYSNEEYIGEGELFFIPVMDTEK